MWGLQASGKPFANYSRIILLKPWKSFPDASGKIINTIYNMYQINPTYILNHGGVPSEIFQGYLYRTNTSWWCHCKAIGTLPVGAISRSSSWRITSKGLVAFKLVERMERGFYVCSRIHIISCVYIYVYIYILSFVYSGRYQHMWHEMKPTAYLPFYSPGKMFPIRGPCKSPFPLASHPRKVRSQNVHWRPTKRIKQV